MIYFCSFGINLPAISGGCFIQVLYQTDESSSLPVKSTFANIFVYIFPMHLIKLATLLLNMSMPSTIKPKHFHWIAPTSTIWMDLTLTLYSRMNDNECNSSTLVLHYQFCILSLNYNIECSSSICNLQHLCPHSHQLCLWMDAGLGFF